MSSNPCNSATILPGKTPSPPYKSSNQKGILETAETPVLKFHIPALFTTDELIQLCKGMQVKFNGEGCIKRSFGTVLDTKMCTKSILQEKSTNKAQSAANKIKKRKTHQNGRKLKKVSKENVDPLRIGETGRKIRKKEDLRKWKNKYARIYEAKNGRKYILKKLTVPGLYSTEKLRDLCNEKGLHFVDSDEGDAETEDFEVEDIVEESFEKGVQWYLVKWVNYPHSQNTWEPAEHIHNCDRLLENVRKKKFSILNKKTGFVSRNLVEKFITNVVKEKDFCDIATLQKLNAIGNEKADVFNLKTKTGIKQLQKSVLRIAKYSQKTIIKYNNTLLSISKFAKARAQCLRHLKAWERDMNSANESVPLISVANNIDCEGPPEFHFITDLVYTHVEEEPDTTFGCRCTTCSDKDSCCPKLAATVCAYNSKGNLILPPGYPIYECNKNCSCDENCPTRVVQKGSKIHTEIFRTENRGWGVRTLHPLRRGQFVMEYIGELITSEEAEQRRCGERETYLFDLDFEETTNAYTIDAKDFGNVSRFFNHSCDPNMHVYAVWVNHLNVEIPRLAFFAKRNIRQGEELTFNYKMSRTCDTSESESDSPMLCLCGERRCQKYLVLRKFKK